ncbi:hypothetical protein Tco_1095601 [Tanacetum coccineum]
MPSLPSSKTDTTPSFKTISYFTWIQSMLNPRKDRCPVVLNIPKILTKKIRAFRFTSYIADKPEFLEIVGKEWNINIKGCQMFKLVKKLKAMKYHMKNLNWKHGNLYERVASCRDKLKAIQIEVDKDPHNQAKIEWLNDGDKNSKFFHAVLKGRNHKDKIDMVCDEHGERFKGCNVAKQFVKHFQSFIRAAHQVETSPLNSLKVTKVTMEDASYMVRTVKDDEVKDALFDICDNKAPGPNGYTSKFYKKSLKHCR